MNPMELGAVNLRSWRRLHLVLPEGCTAISGPNGAGKTTILSIIELALFAGKGELARQMSRDPDGDTCEVALVFDHADDIYRVRRTYSQRAGKTLVALDLWSAAYAGDPGWETAEEAVGPVEEHWISLSGETAAVTQERLEQILGLDRRTFRASSFIAQGDGAAFTLAQPRDRKDILASILGLDVWERLAARAALEREREKALIAQLDAQLAMLEPVIARAGAIRAESEQADGAFADARVRREAAVAACVALRERVADAAEKRHHIDQARLHADRIGERVSTANARYEQLRRQIGEAREGDVSPSDRSLVDRLPALEAEQMAVWEAQKAWRERDGERLRSEQLADRARVVLERARSDFARAEDAYRDAVKRRQALDWAEVCPTCGQELGEDARAEAVRQADAAVRQCAEASRDVLRLRGVASDAYDRLVAMVPQAEPEPQPRAELAGLIRDAGEIAKRVAAAEERLRLAGEWEHEAAEVNHARAELAAEQTTAQRDLSAALSGFDADADAQIRATLAVAERDAERLLIVLDEAHQRLTRARIASEQLADAERDHDAAASDLHDAREALAAVTTLERAYGRNGIPAMLMEQAAIPQIEAEANRVLGELGTSFSTELRTQRQLKSGGQADALDIIVHGPGGEALYEDLSGGERTRVDVALRLGLARLLAHRKGTPVRFLAMDEPAHLDDEGMMRLATVLASLDSAFDRILLVSHVSTLGEAFDQQLHVAKQGDESRLVGDPEAVIA